LVDAPNPCGMVATSTPNINKGIKHPSYAVEGDMDPSSGKESQLKSWVTA
jgi:hypothetical protein